MSRNGCRATSKQGSAPSAAGNSPTGPPAGAGPTLDYAFFDSKMVLDAYVCENPKAFADLYSNCKNETPVDSATFDTHKLLSFGIVTTNGDSLERYSFSVKSDTCYVHCTIKQSDNPALDLAIPYIITLKAKK